METLRPDKSLSIRFPGRGEPQTVFRSTDRTQLVALDELAGRGPRVYALDLVQWRDEAMGPYLRRRGVIVQRFQASSDGLSEIHLRMFRISERCRFEASVFELVARKELKAQPSRISVGGGVKECSTDEFQVIPVNGSPSSAGRTYELELRGTGDGSAAFFSTAPVLAYLESFEGFSLEDGRQVPVPRAERRVLAFRVVVKGRRQTSDDRGQR